MKVVRWYGKRDVRVDDVPEPSVEDGTVKVKVTWAGICGSDVHEFIAGPILISSDKPHPLTNKKAPIIIGHEFGGYVVDIGKGVKGLNLNDKVTVSPLLYCGKCIYCRSNRQNLCVNQAYMGFNTDGGMAEYVVVPRENVYVMKDDVPSDILSFGEPIAVAVHALNMANITPKSHVAVVGGGTIGLLIAQIALLKTPNVYLFESSREKRELIRKKMPTPISVSNPFNKDDVYLFMEKTGGGADFAFDAGGSHVSAGFMSSYAPSKSSLGVALNLARKNGKVIAVAIHYQKSHPLNLVEFVKQEKIVMGSWTYLPSDFEQGVALINSGQIEPSFLITSRIFIDNIVEDGLLELELNGHKHIKILVTAHHDYLERQKQDS